MSSVEERLLIFENGEKARDLLKFYEEHGAQLGHFEKQEDAFAFAKTGRVKPNREEFAVFYKLIKSENYKAVKTLIWSNPLYLVSYTGMPAIVKRETNYNALHICALMNKPGIAELILQTVSNAEFVKLIIGETTDQKVNVDYGAKFLERFLNNQDKYFGETPLHIASKYGAADVVEILTSYSQCKSSYNKKGELPGNMICYGALSKPDVRGKIKLMLEGCFYVPVLRSVDNIIPPAIGEPFKSDNPPNLNQDPLSPIIKIDALAGPMKQEQAMQFYRRWKKPPIVNDKTLSDYNIFIAPVRPRTIAESTEKHNSQTISTLSSTTPGNSLPYNKPDDHNVSNAQNHINSNNPPTAKKTNAIRKVSDSTKKINITVYDFPDKRVKSNSKKSTKLPEISVPKNCKPVQNNDSSYSIEELENTLKAAASLIAPPLKDNPKQLNEKSTASCKEDTKREACSPQRLNFECPRFKERHIKFTDLQKGLEIIGRVLARDYNVEWREYWDFLDLYLDISSLIGLQHLENYIGKRSKEEIGLKRKVETTAKSVRSEGNIGKRREELYFRENDRLWWRRVVFHRSADMSNNIQPAKAVASAPKSSAPKNCIENDVHDLVKRMTEFIVHNADNMPALNSYLSSELEKLKMLVFNLKDDLRYLYFGFTNVHSCIGNLILNYFENSPEVTPLSKLMTRDTIKYLFEPGERCDHRECVCVGLLGFEECSMSPKAREDCDAADIRAGGDRSYNSESKKLCDLSQHDEEDLDGPWYTPPDSPSCSRATEKTEEKREEEKYTAFITGNKPSKRDVDVLNGILHVDLEHRKYPHIHEWKTAMLRYSNEEMEAFLTLSINPPANRNRSDTYHRGSMM